MINITDKKDCCGCGACVQICPKRCISMSTDNEGFLYPQVNTEECINCGLCEKACPVINQNQPKDPLAVYAAKNKNEEIRQKSSSGGIFTLLAEQVLFEGGVVFGAKFDENWNVVHDYTETIEGLEVFRGSKYVQSTIGDCFIKAKQFLVAGRKVLFSGTPCQIAGLKKYLRKEYSNLLSVDIICHGVPSSMVWKKYLDEIKELRFSACSESVKIEDINFRDKTKGWNNYLCSYYMMNNNKAGILSYNHLNDPYMRLFLTNHSLRPSCYCCPGKAGKSGSDITIGDCWGIGRISKTLNDDKGVGVCVMHNNNDILDTIISSSQHLILSMDYLAKYNKSYYYSSLMPYERKKFFETITSTNSVIFAAKQFAPAKGFITRFVERMTRFVKRHLNH